MGSISFCMPIGDVLEPDDVLYVPVSIEESSFSLNHEDLRCVAEFDDQQVIIRDHNREHGHILAKGMQEGGLYKLLVNSDQTWSFSA
jgi:hypothetical protein